MGFTIRIKYDGKILTYVQDCDSSHTLLSIKQKIHNQTCFPIQNLSLAYNFEHLPEDNNTLSFYEIDQCRRPMLILKLEKPKEDLNEANQNNKQITVYIKWLLTGSSVSTDESMILEIYTIPAVDTIYNIKKQLYYLTGRSIEKQILIFKNKVLNENTCTLANYGIVNDNNKNQTIILSRRQWYFDGTRSVGSMNSNATTTIDQQQQCYVCNS